MDERVQVTVADLVREVLDLGDVELTGGEDLFDDLGADSLSLIALVDAVEASLGVEVDVSDVASVFTVDDLWRLVATRCPATVAAASEAGTEGGPG